MPADPLVFHGEEIGTKIFRKLFCLYTKGLDGIRLMRDKACRAQTKEQMVSIIGELREEQN